MSSYREQLEDYIASLFDIAPYKDKLLTLVEDALNEAAQEEYEIGVEDGREKAEDAAKKEEDSARKFFARRVESLKDRYIYLKLGGEWDKYNYDSPDDYLAGFEDAMKTLGVKP